MTEEHSAENGLLPWGDLPYDRRSVGEMVHDFAVVRGDLSEQYARDQLVKAIERKLARAWDDGWNASADYSSANYDGPDDPPNPYGELPIPPADGGA